MGRTPSCTSDGLKKGAWTAEEDQKLISYLQKHGEGGWRSLPQKAGLQRCGKSCRLRWTNYLKPGIRRGKFTPEEDQTIIKLHAQFGNSGSSSSGNSGDTTAVNAAEPKTDTRCSKPQQFEHKRQRSASALLLNKLATRVSQCVRPLRPMLLKNNSIFPGPFSSGTVPETTPESGNVIGGVALNDIIASEFSSLSCIDGDGFNDRRNNNGNIVTREIQVENHSDPTTVDYYEGLWEDDLIVDDVHMIFDTM
ncbi:hypothetical protein V6N13_091240 [Hibiscus sabdariffa]|uniref:Uncharacterized protein n=1 Tax=Hibiscus sabdariffa TaxID=183260 RepID=A0ABR2BV08_9ROSI